jgi:WG containing repeat
VLPAVRTAIVTTVLLLVAASTAGQNTVAQSPKQPPPENANPTREPDGDKSGATGTPCLFDPERGEVPNCMREDKTGELFVAPQYLKELNFDAHGLASVNSPKVGWMYVNRKGKVVISGVAAMDNGADWFHDGLVRIVRNGKYGFANRRGQVVVSLIYDGAMNFENGRAMVCKRCESKCVDSGCEYRSFAGGEWFRIDVKGTILNRLHPHN